MTILSDAFALVAADVLEGEAGGVEELAAVGGHAGAHEALQHLHGLRELRIRVGCGAVRVRPREAARKQLLSSRLCHRHVLLPLAVQLPQQLLVPPLIIFLLLLLWLLVLVHIVIVVQHPFAHSLFFAFLARE